MENGFQSQVHSLRSVHVCLMEDDQVAARIYSGWLEESEAVVTVLSSFDDLRNRIEAEEPPFFSVPGGVPDILMTDLVLSDGTGSDVISLWRKHFPQRPVIVLTAFATVENAVEAMRMGAFDFLRKPVSREELNLVIDRAREHAKLLHENETLATAVRILGMAQTLSGITEKSNLLKTMGRLLHRETRAAECFVFVHTGIRRQTECLFDCRSAGVPRSAPETILANLVQHRIELLLKIPDPVPTQKQIPEDEVARPPTIIERHDQSGCVIELRSNTGNTAFIALLDTPGRRFDATPLKTVLYPILVQALRGYCAADTNEHMAALSFIDDLTGLYNQRYLEIALTSEIARANRYGTPVSLLFFDLDKFKAINDTHGHIVGSQILREAAKIFRQTTRDCDQLLRYGGDEFVAILPNTKLQGAIVLAERIRSAFDTTFFDVREKTQVTSAQNLHVTASIGVASFPECALTALELIQVADDAMYVSKRLGKNRVSLAKVKPTEPA
jgi:two-component system cell cycle response regulator